MGTQTAIAQTILDGGGAYVLALKENWPASYAEVAQAFADSSAGLSILRSQTVDADHGRIETRQHAICHVVDWLFSERRHPDEFRLPGLAAIAMVESRTERGGTIERQKRFYFCSRKRDAEIFARVVRSHWGIENRLHWVLEVVFRDDLARLRSGNGPANMAVIKHTALNMLGQAKPTTSLKNRRKKPDGTRTISRRSSATAHVPFKRFPWMRGCYPARHRALVPQTERVLSDRIQPWALYVRRHLA